MVPTTQRAGNPPVTIAQQQLLMNNQRAKSTMRGDKGSDTLAQA